MKVNWHSKHLVSSGFPKNPINYAAFFKGMFGLCFGNQRVRTRRSYRKMLHWKKNDAIDQSYCTKWKQSEKGRERERYVTIHQVFFLGRNSVWFETIQLVVASRDSSVMDPSVNTFDCLHPQVILSTNRHHRRTTFRRPAEDQSSNVCEMRRQIVSLTIPVGNHPVWPGLKQTIRKVILMKKKKEGTANKGTAMKCRPDGIRESVLPKSLGIRCTHPTTYRREYRVRDTGIYPLSVERLVD